MRTSPPLPDAWPDESARATGGGPGPSADADPQREVVRFLARADCPAYETGERRLSAAGERRAVETIDTHTARLFLGERIVCKIKRAVAYGYLDMSALDARRRLCERELEINRRTLPDVYLDVVAVTREEDGSLALDGAGEPVEWVLRMHRFAQRDVLDEVAREHRLSAELARRLGEAIARFHAALPPEATDDGFERVIEIVDELDAEFAALGGVLPRARTERFARLARAVLTRERARLDRRASAGFVRRCHGDLHLRNVLLRDGRPVPFDALEFDERLATTDVLYDLAFLVMDLGHRDLPMQQNLVLNEYLRRSPEENVAALSLLPPFLALRAAVRAMTTAQGAHGADADGRSALEREAGAYLDAALDYLEPRRPILIAVGGPSGSGKSTVAASLASRVAPPPGAILLGSDAERKGALGVHDLDRLDPACYTAAASEANYRLLFRKAAHALRGGFTTIVDATWLGAAERARARALARRSGVPFVGLWLDAPATTLRRRVALRRDDVSDATLAVLEAQLADAPLPPPGWHRIDAEEPVRTLEEALAIVDGVGAADGGRA